MIKENLIFWPFAVIISGLNGAGNGESLTFIISSKIILINL